jgi:hypothetical protein
MMKKLTEKAMSKQENRIPKLAENAVKQARLRTLASGRSVIEAVDGNLIESRPDGTFKVIRSLAAPIPVTPGQTRIRKCK